MADNSTLREADTWYPMDADETDWVPGDYADVLDDGETLQSVTSTCEATQGIDVSPSSRKSGAVAVSGSKVKQLLTGVLAGEIYVVRFRATTSAGRVLVLAGRLPVVREV